MVIYTYNHKELAQFDIIFEFLMNIPIEEQFTANKYIYLTK